MGETVMSIWENYYGMTGLPITEELDNVCRKMVC